MRMTHCLFSEAAPKHRKTKKSQEKVCLPTPDPNCFCYQVVIVQTPGKTTKPVFVLAFALQLKLHQDIHTSTQPQWILYNFIFFLTTLSYSLNLKCYLTPTWINVCSLHYKHCNKIKGSWSTGQLNVSTSLAWEHHFSISNLGLAILKKNQKNTVKFGLNGLRLFHLINILTKQTCRHRTDSVGEREGRMKSSVRKKHNDAKWKQGGREISAAYHREPKVPHSYSPRRASLPLQSRNHRAELSRADEALDRER